MSDERSIREIRLEKLARMRQLGYDPYSVERFDRSHSATELLEQFDSLRDSAEQVRFAGRVVSHRLMGRAGFAHLSDGDEKIQAYFKKDRLGDVGWEIYNLLDIGDHLGVEGSLFNTKTGEKTIEVHALTPLSKCLQVLPIGKTREVKDDHGKVLRTEHWYELEDVDQRYRHRHLDLIANPEARKLLTARMKITSAVRRYFDKEGFVEAETPILQVLAGGALARPFQTHFNAYDMSVKLRISLELYLKRLICGDLPKVYEIGRVFRNEGVSNRHNPEFTLLEFYEAYVNLEDMMRRVEELFAFVAEEAFGNPAVQAGEAAIDFSRPWKRVSLLEEIEKQAGVTEHDLSSLDAAKRALGSRAVVNPANGKRIEASEEDNLGGLIEKLLEVFVEPTLQQPTFVIGYPIDTSPLAKKDPNNPRMTRRFEGYIRGREVCNAFSEINDPIDQRERFEQQMRHRDKGDQEAHPLDDEFLFALESGMPPTGGCGIGIDRMAMVLTGADHIREVLPFPMMKPVQQD